MIGLNETVLTLSGTLCLLMDSMGLVIPGRPSQSVSSKPLNALHNFLNTCEYFYQSTKVWALFQFVQSTSDAVNLVKFGGRWLLNTVKDFLPHKTSKPSLTTLYKGSLGICFTVAINTEYPINTLEE